MDINYLSVLLAALSAFFLGAIWYTAIFAKPWQKLIGMSDKGKGSKSTSETPGLGRLLISSLVLWLGMAYVLAWFLSKNDTNSLLTGLAAGFGVSALSFGNNYLFEGKPFSLWLINAGYNTVAFTIMSLIIGAM